MQANGVMTDGLVLKLPVAPLASCSSPQLSSDNRLFWLHQINKDKTNFNHFINKMVDLFLLHFIYQFIDY